MVGRAKKTKVILVSLSVIVMFGILNSISKTPDTIQHEGKYGIYTLDLTTNKVSLIYSTNNEIYTSALRLNSRGDTFVFAQKADGLNLKRLTSNSYWDLYPQYQ